MFRALVFTCALVFSGTSASESSGLPPAMDVQMDRAFFRLDEGLVHVRSIAGADAAVPLVLLHPSPSSSRAMEPLMRALAMRRPGAAIIAPDALGNGDSAAPLPATPDIGYFAGALARLLAEMALGPVDVYGSHTGARIAAEFAAAYPHLVRRVVLDGIVDYPAQLREQILASYAPRIEPDDYGRQFVWAFNFTRDQSLYFPYFMRTAENRLVASVPSAEELHLRTIDILKALHTYHLPYLAAFRYRASERVAAIEAPVLLLISPSDAPILREGAAELARLMRDSRVLELGPGIPAKADAIAEFLQ